MNPWKCRQVLDCASPGAINTSKAAEGRRGPRRCRADACPFRFMVPMRALRILEVFKGITAIPISNA